MLYQKIWGETIEKHLKDFTYFHLCSQTLMSKKIITIALVGIGYLFLLYKVWDIFGFWRIVLTNIGLIISGVYLGKLASARRVTENGILYNPKEFPKFINIGLSMAIGYYLYTVLGQSQVSSSDFIFGISYLALSVVVPAFYAIYKLIRDRNDFVVISSDALRYQDNSHSGEYRFADIEGCKMEGGTLKLSLKDGSLEDIALNQMNFNLADMIILKADLDSRMPKPVAEDASDIRENINL